MRDSTTLGLALIFGLSIAGPACTKEAGGRPSEVSEGPGSGADDEGETEGDGQAPSDRSAGAKEECERYLACVNEATPETGGAAVALYGDDSSCWKGSAADAKSCGDACRLARGAVAREGDTYPHCGCDSDAECRTFCSEAQTCVGSAWSGILEACASYAADAKAALAAWKKTQEGSFSCMAIANANCEAIRALDFKGSYADDSQGRGIQAQSLEDYYAQPRKGAAAWDIVMSLELGPSSSGSCTHYLVFGLGRTAVGSVDLALPVK